MSDYRDNGLTASVWRDTTDWVVRMCNGTEARYPTENKAEIAAEDYVLGHANLRIIEIDGTIMLKPNRGLLN